jgi:hypothetical protein
MLDPERLAGYMERGTIEVAPLAFMRGRTLNDSFVVLDEAQNTTPEQMQMFLTRLGFGSKMVVTGRRDQVDLPARAGLGLIQVREILAGIDGIGFVEFGNEDVVRHKLVQRSSRRTSVTPRRPARRAAGDPRRDGEPQRRRRRRGARRRSSPRRARREGVDDGELGIAFVGADEMRALKREHLGIDEATDVLSFPLDGRDELPEGVPRALGDVVLCPQVVGEEWRGPLVHGSCTSRVRPRRRHGGARGGARADGRASAASRSSRASTSRRRGSSTPSARSGTSGSTSPIAVAVLVAAIGFGASKLELAVLLLAITFVLVRSS